MRVWNINKLPVFGSDWNVVLTFFKMLSLYRSFFFSIVYRINSCGKVLEVLAVL